MNKKSDPVRFQRKMREELSEKYNSESLRKCLANKALPA
jgi:hypothetical protein